MNDMRFWSVATVLLTIFALFAGIMIGKENAGITNVGVCQRVILQQHTIGNYKLVPSEGYSFYSCIDPK